MASNPNQGFKLPGQIPGAPERVTIGELLTKARSILMQSLDIFLRRPNALEKATIDTTWWDYGMTVATGAVISGVLFTLAAIFIVLRLSALGLALDLLTPVLVLILSPIVTFVAFHAGCYASHWYAVTQQNSQAPLLQHCQTIALPWLAGSVLASLIGALSLILFGGFFTFDVFSPSGFGFITSLPILALLAVLAAAVISIYTLVLIFGALKQLHRFEGLPLWLTFLLFIVVENIVTNLLSRIFSL